MNDLKEKWNNLTTMKKGIVSVVTVCCIGILLIGIIGSGTPDENTNTETSNEPVKEEVTTTSSEIENKEEAKKEDNKVINTDLVELSNGKIFINSEEVGTYEIVTSPPPLGKDVEKRLWRNKREEIVDFRGTDTSVSTYYTKYNGQWLKLNIKTGLDATPLSITNDIYSAMDN